MSSRLEALGTTVLELPLVHIRLDVDRDTCTDVLTELGSYDWIVFTSANGVRFFFDLFKKGFNDLRSLGYTGGSGYVVIEEGLEFFRSQGCDALDCAARNRACESTPTAVCTACLARFIEDGNGTE